MEPTHEFEVRPRAGQIAPGEFHLPQGTEEKIRWNKTRPNLAPPGQCLRKPLGSQGVPLPQDPNCCGAFVELPLVATPCTTVQVLARRALEKRSLNGNPRDIGPSTQGVFELSDSSFAHRMNAWAYRAAWAALSESGPQRSWSDSPPHARTSLPSAILSVIWRPVYRGQPFQPGLIGSLVLQLSPVSFACHGQHRTLSGPTPNPRTGYQGPVLRGRPG